MIIPRSIICRPRDVKRTTYPHSITCRPSHMKERPILATSAFPSSFSWRPCYVKGRPLLVISAVDHLTWKDDNSSQSVVHVMWTTTIPLSCWSRDVNIKTTHRSASAVENWEEVTRSPHRYTLVTVVMYLHVINNCAVILKVRTTLLYGCISCTVAQNTAHDNVLSCAKEPAQKSLALCCMWTFKIYEIAGREHVPKVWTSRTLLPLLAE